MIGTVEGRGQPDGAAADGEEDESLSIINESDFSPLTRSFLSQLTTPRATPLLSPQTPSPRSSWSAGPEILLKHYLFGTRQAGPTSMDCRGPRQLPLLLG